jgi:hypothetical protein
MRALWIGVLPFSLLAFGPPAPAQSKYDHLTTRHRVSHCHNRVRAIRDRMRPGMREMFGSTERVHVYVKKVQMLNAYADGYAIVFSPVMCEALRNDDMLAIIVGHEVAHNLLGHYKEGLAGSKDREREADYYGLYLAAHADYDISLAPDMWRAFAHATGGGSGGITHPTYPERSARAMLVFVEVTHKKRDNQPILPDFRPDLWMSPLPDEGASPAPAGDAGRDD